MSATENIALRLAERFDPEHAGRLQPAVKNALAKARGEETPYRSVDPNTLLAFAGLVVTIAGTAWSVYVAVMQKRGAEADAELRKKEIALLEEIRDRLAERAPLLPQQEALRMRIVEAAAEEAIAEGERQRQRQV